MASSRNPALLAIIAHARSGALEHAWRLYRRGRQQKSAVLSVRGRLLKDQALAAPEGGPRRRLFLRAADAYAEGGMRHIQPIR